MIDDVVNKRGEPSASERASIDFEPFIPIPGVTYPEPSLGREFLKRGFWTGTTIGEAVAANARALPGKTAVVDGAARLTWAQLEERASALATGMLELGLEPSDRIIVQMGQTLSTVVMLTACFKSGIIPVCTVPQYRAHEIRTLAGVSGARAHAVEVGAAGTFDLESLACEMREVVDSLEFVLVEGASHVDGAVDLQQLEHRGRELNRRPSDVSPFAAIGIADVAAFQLSGGSTSVPKIIPRFHGEYLGYALQYASRLELRHDDVLLWALSLTHNAGMIMYLLPSVGTGATLVLQRRFEVEQFLEVIEREQVTVTGSIGPIARRLIDYEAEQDYDLNSLRYVHTLAYAEDLEDRLGARACNVYGITEGILCASHPSWPASVRHHTNGALVSAGDEAKLLPLDDHDEGRTADFGELCFRGPSVLPSYFGAPDANRGAFTDDGFFRSGDLVRRHIVGGRSLYSFEGRAKDNIDRGGEKFGVDEIEALMAGHPSIREAAVVGMPDRYLGERACAFVVQRPDTPRVTVEEMGEFLLARGLAKFKLPECIEVVEELPLTAVGKLDRRALRVQAVEFVKDEGEA
jgi:salicylate---[aryl-carrier protein] ligase